MTAHELARQLLAGPDLRVALANAEYLHATQDPYLGTTTDGVQFVVLDPTAYLGKLPVLPPPGV